MESIRQIQQKYCSRAILLAIAAGTCFIVAEMKPVGKGVILGALFSIFNFLLIARSIPRRMDASRNRAIVYSFGSILFRYLLMAIPLIVALKLDAFDLVGVIFGLFSIQIVILADQLLIIVQSTRAKHKQV